MSDTRTQHPSARGRRCFERIVRDLDQLTALARDPAACEARAPAVSGWSVGQQLEHLALVDTAVLDRLAGVDLEAPAEPQGKPKLIARAMLALGFIPRGKGKAPDAVQPVAEEVDREALAAAFDDVKRRFAELEPKLALLEAYRGTFPHPVLGQFSARDWLRFVVVHHHHHHKIIRDIQKSA